jgi:hypothetical protein
VSGLWTNTRNCSHHKHTENWIDHCWGKAAAGVRWPGKHDQATNLVFHGSVVFYRDRCVDFTAIFWRKWELQRCVHRRDCLPNCILLWKKGRRYFISLHNLQRPCSVPSIIRMIKTRRMGWTGHEAPRRTQMHVGFWWETQERKGC